MAIEDAIVLAKVIISKRHQKPFLPVRVSALNVASTSVMPCGKPVMVSSGCFRRPAG
jgi:hypothetical protein